MLTPTSYSTLLNKSQQKQQKIPLRYSLFVKIIVSEDFILTVSYVFEILIIAVVPYLYYRTIYQFKSYIIMFKSI